MATSLCTASSSSTAPTAFIRFASAIDSEPLEEEGVFGHNFVV